MCGSEKETYIGVRQWVINRVQKRSNKDRCVCVYVCVCMCVCVYVCIYGDAVKVATLLHSYTHTLIHSYTHTLIPVGNSILHSNGLEDRLLAERERVVVLEDEDNEDEEVWVIECSCG